MPTTSNLPSAVPQPRDLHERLELANRLYREFHARCFWHSPRDLVITEDLISFVVKGLRRYGGRRGFILASKLQPKPATSDQEGAACL